MSRDQGELKTEVPLLPEVFSFAWSRTTNQAFRGMAVSREDNKKTSRTQGQTDVIQEAKECSMSEENDALIDTN